MFASPLKKKTMSKKEFQQLTNSLTTQKAGPPATPIVTTNTCQMSLPVTSGANGGIRGTNSGAVGADGGSRRASCASTCSSISSQRSFYINNSQDENAILDDDIYNISSTESPTLMATSMDSNRLLPSLSTISLLSLGRDQQYQQQYMDNNSSSTCSPELKKRTTAGGSSRPGSRTTSFSSHARASFHQQRHPQMYRRASQQQVQQAQQQQITIQIPETPHFGPTSVTSSPSGFILSQQQLPASLQRQHGFPPGLNRQNSSNTTTTTTATLTNGSSSPLLYPVGNNDEVPMTPLMLSNPGI